MRSARVAVPLPCQSVGRTLLSLRVHGSILLGWPCTFSIHSHGLPTTPIKLSGLFEVGSMRRFEAHGRYFRITRMQRRTVTAAKWKPALLTNLQWSDILLLYCCQANKHTSKRDLRLLISKVPRSDCQHQPYMADRLRVAGRAGATQVILLSSYHVISMALVRRD